MAPTVQTRINRPCESRLICTASKTTCSRMTPASSTSDLCREGMATMALVARASAGALFLQSAKTSSKNLPLLLVNANLPQQFEVTQHFPRAQHHRRQRIVGDRNGQTGLLANSLVQIFQECSAARQHDAAVADVRGKFRRRALQ